MKYLLQYLADLMKSIHSESYYQINTSKSIVYPYLVYNTDIEWLERNTEGVTLEIDLFGTGTSMNSVIELEEKLKDALIFKDQLTDTHLYMFSFRNAITVPTLVDNLQRRNLTFYIRVTERSKQYGTTN